MAVTLTSADKALKSYYIDAVAEQLNNANPFLSAIKHTTENVYGKEVKKLSVFGMNGGIGAGTEDGNLPTSVGNNYGLITAPLKNLYGTIEISDKAIRASENSAGAFVDLLNSEMDGLIKASSFNLGRMLFGDGSGALGKVSSVSNGVVVFDTVQNMVEGMIVDFRSTAGVLNSNVNGRKITAIDRANKAVMFSGATITTSTLSVGELATVQGSYDNEITGLDAIFTTNTNLYGLSRTTNYWLNPYIKSSVGTLTLNEIQSAIDRVEENGGSPANMIICSYGVRRALVNLLATNRNFVDSMELKGGYSAISYNGIPVVADRFCPAGYMYILNTDDFALHQLCDWEWLTGDDGKILKQVAGKPVYTATLVKYAELICARPYGQGLLKGITEA